MAVGIDFLRAVCAEQNVSLLHQVDATYFLDDERPFYQFVRNHYDNYHSLPDARAQAIGRFTFNTPLVNNGQYWFANLVNRTRYNAVRRYYSQFQTAIKTYDWEQLLGITSAIQSSVMAVGASQGYTNMHQQAQAVWEDYQIARRSSDMRGIPTPWATLNQATGGWAGGDLVVIAGRPGMGKSWSLLKCMEAAFTAGKKCGFVSMEMSPIQIARRWIGLRAGINPNLIRQGTMTTYSERRMRDLIARMADEEALHILSGDMSKTTDKVVGMIDQLHPDIMFVDAVYLLSPSGMRLGYVKRWEALTEVIRELKQCTIKNGIPIVITVQLNRNVKTNSRRELDSGDISGSDSIPQDASILLGQRHGPGPFGYRYRYYDFMKNRDGETPDFMTNFVFDPPNFDEVPIPDDDASGEPVEPDASTGYTY